MGQIVPHKQLSHAEPAFTNTATALEATGYVIPKRADAVIIQARGADAVVTFDGTTPTATHGLLFKDGAEPVLFPLDFPMKLRAIRGASTNGTLSLVFVDTKRNGW